MSITEKTINNRVFDFLTQHGINKNSSILVAYSGGPDSGVLISILTDIREIMGYSLNAVYIDHGIRSRTEMIAEYNHIKKNFKTEVTIHIKHIPSGKIALDSEKTGRSVEDLAREYRYRIFEELKKEIGASHVATGHTLDDQLETLIMRFFQGSGIHGLSGIPDVRESYIRPLLTVEKQEILEYLSINKISFVTDKTNLSNIYLRNKIRHKLIPVIRDVFPGYRSSLCSFSEKMDAVRAVLERTVPSLEIKVNKDGDSYFSYSDFVDQPLYRQIDTLYKSWNLWETKPF
ncbi:MAG: tRNA lysidine(34) synthetase TilS, partial [Spirochaetales bacterium]|nr:tRNA lysidine(34) synthetase TilS [Spirochaetales bacterium]